MPIYNRIEDGDEKSAYQEYLEENGLGILDIEDKSTYRLNWDNKISWDRSDYLDANYAAILEGGIGPDLLEDYEGFFIPADSTPNGLRAFKTKRIKYSFREFDLDKNKWSDYKEIEVYPDTTVWYKDFNYSYNEPMHNDYFWHDAYSDYPVVGVSWEQAKAFADWRTFYKNQHNRKKKKDIQLVSRYRLPTEAEWEYAARGGIERAEYPWGGPYTYDEKGCFLANFKPERGDYAADQILYTAEAESYWPNDYGLYNMSGNVSEWTDSNYEKSANDFVAGINPNIEGDNNNSRKVVRGGSWKDVAHYLKVSTRDYEYQNKKRSYIGFRTVQSYLGEDVGFQENPNKIF
jgi:gliding motility-associated lipoprotein GldK